MAFDPFEDNAPADEAQNTSGPWDEPQASGHIPPALAAPAGENKVRVTLKGGAGYEAPWITLDGANTRDALAQFDDSASLKTLIEQTSLAASYFHKTYNAPARPAAGNSGGTSGGAQQSQQQKPPQQQAPNGQTEYCDHGEMVYRTGLGKNNKTWKAFMCPAPKGSTQCDPRWVR